MDAVSHVLAMVAIGYLCGSIPFARLFTFHTGVDLFSTGTGNPGAANVFRRVGKRVGIAVLIADGLKGAAPVVITRMMGSPEDILVIGGAAAIAGHWYPLFNRFRGGAGLATGTGAAIALMPWAGLIGCIVGFLVIAKWKSSGHAALAGLVVILALAIPIGYEWPAMAAASGFASALAIRGFARGWKPGRKD